MDASSEDPARLASLLDSLFGYDSAWVDGEARSGLHHDDNTHEQILHLFRHYERCQALHPGEAGKRPDPLDP